MELLRRVPRALAVQHFQDPTDRAASRALQMAAPVQALVQYYLRWVQEPEHRNELLVNSVRAGPKQCSRVYRLARSCEEILHTAPVEVYVSNSATSKAMAFGSGKTDVIVLTISLVDYLSDDELLFVLGQQLGKVKANQVVYLTLAKALSTALKGIPALGGPLSSAANTLLVPWQRTAILTTDRAGLLCCQDLAAATRALTRLAWGFSPSSKGVDIARWILQSKELANQKDWGDTWKDQPALLRRILALAEFRSSPQWDRIFQDSWDPSDPFFPCHYCQDGAGLPDPGEPLGDLSCPSCHRSIPLDEIPCPSCNQPIPTPEGSRLADLPCPHCEKPYLDSDQAEYFRAQRGAGGPENPYRVLEVHPRVATQGIQRSFRSKISDLESRVFGLSPKDPVAEKIRLYRAFKTLSDPVRRAHWDAVRRLLGFWNAAKIFHPPDSRCDACRAPLAGPYCALCGQSAPGEAEAQKNLLGAIPAVERSRNSRFQRVNGGFFSHSQHQAKDSYYLGQVQDLDRPSAIQDLLRNLTDLENRSRPGTRCHFLLEVQGHFDRELFETLAQEPLLHPPIEPGTPFLTLLRPQEGGVCLEDVPAPEAPGTPYSSPLRALEEFLDRESS